GCSCEPDRGVAFLPEAAAGHVPRGVRLRIVHPAWRARRRARHGPVRTVALKRPRAPQRLCAALTSSASPAGTAGTVTPESGTISLHPMSPKPTESRYLTTA